MLLPANSLRAFYSIPPNLVEFKEDRVYYITAKIQKEYRNDLHLVLLDETTTDLNEMENEGSEETMIHNVIDLNDIKPVLYLVLEINISNGTLDEIRRSPSLNLTNTLNVPSNTISI